MTFLIPFDSASLSNSFKIALVPIAAFMSLFASVYIIMGKVDVAVTFS